MSAYCPHCGRNVANGVQETVNATVVLQRDRRDKGDGRWSCLASLCPGKQGVTPKTNDVALNSEFNDSGAIYKRRATIQFQLDPVIQDAPARRTTYNKNSILKAKVKRVGTRFGLLEEDSFVPLKQMFAG